MRKLNRLIAAGALAVPMALGASSIAGADVGSLADQDLGQQELPGVNQEPNEGGSGDQGADARQEAQNLGDDLREEAQNVRDDIQEEARSMREDRLEEAQNSRDESQGGDASSNESTSGDESDSDAEPTQELEGLFEMLTDNSVEGPGEGSPLG